MIGLLPLLCGAFVARTDGLRFNDSLHFVVVRDGTHTTMSVQNTYRGPIEDFALLVPVPAVLHEGDVKTLDKKVFDAFDGLTGPMVSELTERDPCEPDSDEMVAGGAPGGARGGVTVESQFAVGEYDVAVLSATESTALDTWLADNGYKIPPALSAQLRPYIAGGSKFFVAKVDPKRLIVNGDTATLSPLRFSYDAPELTLPLRLSAATSAGVQDIVIYAIARGNQEMTVANRPTIRIPSNLDITADAAAQFPAFYDKLFARALDKTPDAAVIEYAGSAHLLPPGGLSAVGADPQANDLALTRIHLQVKKDGKLDDVVLAAQPMNSWFQAQYAHKTRWTGPIACANPVRGRYRPAAAPVKKAGTLGALDTLVESEVPSLGITGVKPPAPPAKSGCGCASSEPASGIPLGLLGYLALRGRRRSAARSRSQ